MKGQKFIPLVVIAAGWLAYQNSFTGPFIYDDQPSILHNPLDRGRVKWLPKGVH